MAGTSTLQMINSIPKFDGTNYVEWTRSYDDILQMSWPFLNKIVSGLKKTEPILRCREEDPIEGVCVCVFSSHSFWTSSSLDVPAGVTQYFSSIFLPRCVP